MWAEIAKWVALYLGIFIVFLLGWRMGRMSGMTHEIHRSIAFWKANENLARVAAEQRWSEEEFKIAADDLYLTVYGEY